MAGLGADGAAVASRNRRRLRHRTSGQRMVATRLSALRAERAATGSRLSSGAVARRVPFWSVLVGVYIAAGLLDASTENRERLDKGLYVIAAASLTFLASRKCSSGSSARTERIRLVPPDDHAHRKPGSHRRRHRRAAGRAERDRAADYADADSPRRRRPRGRARATGHASQSVCRIDPVAKHIRIGNYIKLSSGEEGYLVDIDWRASRLRQLTNNTVLVPNAKFSQSIVTNYHSPDHELVVTIEASVDYKSDLDRVEAITIEVARDVMHTVQGGVPDWTRRAIPHFRRPRHRLLGGPACAGIRRPIPHQARVRETTAQTVRRPKTSRSRSNPRAAERRDAGPVNKRCTTAGSCCSSRLPPWSARFPGARRVSGSSPNHSSADLGIGRVDYAQLNLWATLIGAAGAIGIGRFIDRFGSRVVLAAVAAALGVTVVLMSRVTTFTELAVAVTLTGRSVKARCRSSASPWSVSGSSAASTWRWPSTAWH